MQVPLGVLPKNENKKEEMIEILKHMQQYIPKNEYDIMKMAIMAGDQLTAERIRNVQLIRATSDSEMEKLQGFLPIHADWHAEVTYLKVYIIIDSVNSLTVCS